MSSIDDLRATLTREADGLTDDRLPGRSTAVAHRVRVVRRRRTAVVAAAVVVVLVGAVGAAVNGLNGPPPSAPAPTASPTLLGMTLPPTVQIRGFTYAYAGEIPVTEAAGDGPETVELAPADVSSAYMLVATGLGSGTATLYADGQPVSRVPGSTGMSFASGLGTSSTIRIRLAGTPTGAQTAVADYRLTDAMPEGVSDGVQVFRQTVGGSKLIRADFAESGTTTIDLPFVGDRLRISSTCQSDDGGLNTVVTVDGRLAGGGGCSPREPLDVAGTGYAELDDLGPGRHVAHEVVTDSQGKPVDGGDVRIGLGLYTVPATTNVLGYKVDDEVEIDSRLWRLDRVIPQSGAGTVLARTVTPSREDELLGDVVTSAHNTRVRVTVDGRTVGGAFNATSPTGGQDITLFAGSTYEVRADSADDPSFRAALLLYRPVD